MSTQHTPGPYFIGALEGTYEVVGAEDHEKERLATLRERGLHRFKALSIGTANGQVCFVPLDESNRATAEFIVRACNLHDELLAALRDLLAQIELNPEAAIAFTDEDLAAAHAAIARVEGR